MNPCVTITFCAKVDERKNCDTLAALDYPAPQQQHETFLGLRQSNDFQLKALDRLVSGELFARSTNAISTESPATSCTCSAK
jgi:hypothetical protein